MISFFLFDELISYANVTFPFVRDLSFNELSGPIPVTFQNLDRVTQFL